MLGIVGEAAVGSANEVGIEWDEVHEGAEAEVFQQ